MPRERKKGKNELKQTWRKCYSAFNKLRYQNFKEDSGVAVHDHVEYLICFFKKYIYLLLHFSYLQNIYEHVGGRQFFSDTSNCRYIHCEVLNTIHLMITRCHCTGANVPISSVTRVVIQEKCGIDFSQILLHTFQCSVICSVLVPLLLLRAWLTFFFT